MVVIESGRDLRLYRFRAYLQVVSRGHLQVETVTVLATGEMDAREQVRKVIQPGVEITDIVCTERRDVAGQD